MFVGHYAAAMAAKAVEPKAPMWALAAGCQTSEERPRAEDQELGPLDRRRHTNPGRQLVEAANRQARRQQQVGKKLPAPALGHAPVTRCIASVASRSSSSDSCG